MYRTEVTGKVSLKADRRAGAGGHAGRRAGVGRHTGRQAGVGGRQADFKQ